jgi:hypothetical protein
VRVAPNPTSSVEVFDSEADILQRRIAEQVAAWFSLAGVARSRGKQKRRVVAFLWKQREKMRDEAGASGVCHAEKKRRGAGTRDTKDMERGAVGHAADKGGRRQCDAVTQSGGRGDVGC